MSVSIIFLMLQSLAMDSAAISGWSIKPLIDHHCSLLLGKSWVVTKKFMSMPRRELNAAVLSVKMACLLKKELKLEEIKEWFWTDSRVLIGYIKNNSRRFKTFLANPVQQIRENIDVQQ